MTALPLQGRTASLRPVLSPKISRLIRFALVSTSSITLVAGAMILFANEQTHPGYGLWSKLTAPPERVAAVEHAAYVADVERAQVEQARQFVASIEVDHTVICPDAAKWAKLSPAQQQVWHTYWRTQQTAFPQKLTLWQGSSVCYDP